MDCSLYTVLSRLDALYPASSSLVDWLIALSQDPCWKVRSSVIPYRLARLDASFAEVDSNDLAYRIVETPRTDTLRVQVIHLRRRTRWTFEIDRETDKLRQMAPLRDRLERGAMTIGAYAPGMGQR